MMGQAFRIFSAAIALLLGGCSASADTTATQDIAASDGTASQIVGTLVVGNKGEDSVSFIDLATGAEVKRLETGPKPHEIAISPDGQRAAVVAYGGETIDIFDIPQAKLLKRIDLFPNTRPHGIVWLADGSIMATTEGSDTVTILSPNDCAPNEDCEMPSYAVASMATGNEGSHMLAVQADGNRAYVSNLLSKNVTVLDTASGKKIRDLAAGTEPEGIALTPDGKELWVAARGSDEIFVFDAMSLEQKANITTGLFPIRIAISPDGRYAVTSDLADGGLSVIDTSTKELVRSITVSGSREAAQVTIIFSGDGKRIYLAETGRNTVAEVDFASGKVLRRFAVGEDGDGLGISTVVIAR